MLILALDDEPLALSALNRAIALAAPDAQTISYTLASAALAELETKGLRPDVALLDIEMPGMNGLLLAMRLKEINPHVNIIFVTGFSSYAMEAMQLHASGYLLKPVSEQELRRELEHLRYPAAREATGRVRVRCFGNFDVFVDGAPLAFSRSKAKELFAYLVYKRGAACRTRELAAVLFEDKPYDSHQENYLQAIVSSLTHTLAAVGEKALLIRRYGTLAIDPSRLDCDYYRLLAMDAQAINAYVGEFMSQFSWAEFTAAYLSRSMPQS